MSSSAAAAAAAAAAVAAHHQHHQSSSFGSIENRSANANLLIPGLGAAQQLLDVQNAAAAAAAVNSPYHSLAAFHGGAQLQMALSRENGLLASGLAGNESMQLNNALFGSFERKLLKKKKKKRSEDELESSIGMMAARRAGSSEESGSPVSSGSASADHSAEDNDQRTHSDPLHASSEDEGHQSAVQRLIGSGSGGGGGLQLPFSQLQQRLQAHLHAASRAAATNNADSDSEELVAETEPLLYTRLMSGRKPESGADRAERMKAMERNRSRSPGCMGILKSALTAPYSPLFLSQSNYKNAALMSANGSASNAVNVGLNGALGVPTSVSSANHLLNNVGPNSLNVGGSSLYGRLGPPCGSASSGSDATVEEDVDLDRDHLDRESLDRLEHPLGARLRLDDSTDRSERGGSSRSRSMSPPSLGSRSFEPIDEDEVELEDDSIEADEDKSVEMEGSDRFGWNRDRLVSCWRAADTMPITESQAIELASQLLAVDDYMDCGRSLNIEQLLIDNRSPGSCDAVEAKSAVGSVAGRGSESGDTNESQRLEENGMRLLAQLSGVSRLLSEESNRHDSGEIGNDENELNSGNQQQQHHPVQQHVSANKPTERMNLNEKLCSIGDSIVYKLVQWTKKLPFYDKLPVHSITTVRLTL